MGSISTRVLAAAAVATAFALTTVSAQAQNVRVRGTIEKVDGNVVTVKSRDGGELKLTLKDNANIRGVVKASLADVKASTNVAITSRPRPDGTLQAVELRIFPPGPFNSFHGDWDLTPGSFMTNGAAQTSVAAVDGQMLTVEYKIPPDKTDVKKIQTLRSSGMRAKERRASTYERESGIGLPHSKTLPRPIASCSFREVLECGSPMPL